MDIRANDEGTFIAPFTGFVLGIMLFGLTILQASLYYLRFTRDSLSCKLKVGTVCALDIVHFVFSICLFYANFISIKTQGVASSAISVKMDWRLKALSATQTLLIVLAQIIYLQRIHTLSSIPALNTPTFTRIMNAVICLIGACAICVGFVFGYKVLNIKAALVAASDSDLSWVVYFGFGAAAGLDVIIAALTCFILHNNRREIGLGIISRRSNKLLLSLFTYSLATGILTALAATLAIVLYVGLPTTADYLSMNFITTRLYTNSLLSLVQNVREQLSSHDSADSIVVKLPTEIAFRRLSDPDVEASIPQATEKWNRTSLVLFSNSDSESDIKTQNFNVYSPYYSPLQARKRQIQEHEQMRIAHHPNLSSGTMDRRSSL